MARRDANHRATRERKRTMPDETTFELASVQFGAEPVAVFRFGYERFELRAQLGPGNLEHAIAEAAEVAASVFARWSHEALAFASGLALARTEGQCITRPRITNDCLRRNLVIAAQFGEGLESGVKRAIAKFPLRSEKTRPRPVEQERRQRRYGRSEVRSANRRADQDEAEISRPSVTFPCRSRGGTSFASSMSTTAISLSSRHLDRRCARPSIW